MRALLLAAVAVGCAATTPPEAPRGPAPRVTALPNVPVQPSPADDANGVRLTPLPPGTPPRVWPHVEILEPAFGDHLDLRLAAHQALGIRAEGVLLGVEGEGVLVALDGFRARRLLAGETLRLGDLLPVDQALAEGSHAVLAVALGPDGRAVRGVSPTGQRALSLVEFSVGENSAQISGASRLFCLSPAGTRYEKPDVPLLLDVLAFGPHEKALGLVVESRGRRQSYSVDPELAYSLSGLALGDASFELSSGSGPRSTCRVTLNPELSEPHP